MLESLPLCLLRSETAGLVLPLQTHDPDPEFNFQGLLTEAWARRAQPRLRLPANSFVSLSAVNDSKEKQGGGA